MVKFGLKGSADIIGLLKDGQFVAIECKTGGASRTPQQIKFGDMITRFNGNYYLARDIQGALDFIHAAYTKRVTVGGI